MIRKGLLLTIALLVGLAAASPVRAYKDMGEWAEKVKQMERMWVLDGTGIHNVGNLQMHVTNWGCLLYTSPSPRD